MSVKFKFLITFLLLSLSLIYVNFIAVTKDANPSKINYAYSGKLMDPINAVIQKTVVDETSGRIRFEIQLGVQSFNVESLHYRWIFPSEVRVVLGEQEGDIDGLKPNQSVTLEIEAQGFKMAENENSVLLIERWQGHHLLGSQFTVPSRQDLTGELKTIRKIPEAFKSHQKIKDLDSISKVQTFKMNQPMNQKLAY